MIYFCYLLPADFPLLRKRLSGWVGAIRVGPVALPPPSHPSLCPVHYWVAMAV